MEPQNSSVRSHPWSWVSCCCVCGPQFGLYTLCPELSGAYYESSDHQLGFNWRLIMCESAPTVITDGQYRDATRLALCFGSMFPPVFIALLCLQPRPLYDPATGICGNGDVVARVRKMIQDATPAQYLTGVKTNGPTWCFKGVVDTKGLLDVWQWITLFRTVVRDRRRGRTASSAGQPHMYVPKHPLVLT